MSWLAAAVVALAVLTAFNTLLCLAVIRRLRLRADIPVAPAAAPDLDRPRIGQVVGDFTVPDLAGAPLTAADLDGEAVTLFLSPHCGPCRDVAETLAIRTRPAEPVLAFVLRGDEDDLDAARFAANLPPWTRPALVLDGDPVTAAFGGIPAYPTVVRLRDRVVVAQGATLDAALAATG